MKKEIREAVYKKCGGKCAYCGVDITIGKMQVDHVQSQFLHKNGYIECDLHHIDNLLPACASCNNYKGASTVEMFRKHIFEQPRKLRAASSMLRLAERYGIVTITEKPILFYFETINPHQI